MIVLLPCVWILPRVLPIRPLLAVWIALPLSDVVANLATIPPILRERRSLVRRAKLYYLRSRTSKQARLKEAK